MMNGREKSGPVVVAVNAPNKAGRPAAEVQERRACPWLEQGAGTEGKAGQHDTHRALNRERVTQALDRLRQAAKQRKKERFTALLHHVNPEQLAAGVSRAEARRRSGRRRHDVARVRGRAGAPARRPARPYSSRRVSAATLAPDVHTEGGWARAAAGHCPGGQDRPGRRRKSAE